MTKTFFDFPETYIYIYILYIMYIPIKKTEEKCAGQLFYGFNIQDKLKDCTHEKKKIPYGDLDFWNFVYKRFGINWRVRLSNFASFHTFYL